MKIWVDGCLMVGGREPRHTFPLVICSLRVSCLIFHGFHYAPALKGVYGSNLLFTTKKTPPIHIKTGRKKVRIGAGLDFGELLYMALRTRKLEDRRDER